MPPILQGMAGKVVNVDTLGGYLQYKYGVFFPLVLSLWSILALSGTLAGEARRGSLEFVAATGRSRRRIAIEKLSGHVLALGLVVLVVFVAIAIAGSAFAVLPGDEISVLSAFAYAVWLGLLALAAGSIAFALGPFVGRGAAAGIAGAITFAGFILNGYQAAVPELAPVRQPDVVGLDLEPHRAGRPVRLAPGRPRGGRDRRAARDRDRGLRAA